MTNFRFTKPNGLHPTNTVVRLTHESAALYQKLGLGVITGDKPKVNPKGKPKGKQKKGVKRNPKGK